MRHLSNILLLLVLISGCNITSPEDKTLVEETFPCEKGQMTRAWYEFGMDESIPSISGLRSGFAIIVDTNNKATNFISSEEDFSRRQSIEIDTSDIDWIDNWENLTAKQKLEQVNQERKSYRIQADSTHILNNQKQQQVWIVNNSSDTISIQMQDGSYICVLQAKTKKGQWLPIQYWVFSTCGNSYYNKSFLPKTANSFITEIPDRGDYLTKLRFKLLGGDKYYFSNEFSGRINYCEFVEDSNNYESEFRTGRHFRLDSLINLTWH